MSYKLLGITAVICLMNAALSAFSPSAFPPWIGWSAAAVSGAGWAFTVWRHTP